MQKTWNVLIERNESFYSHLAVRIMFATLIHGYQVHRFVFVRPRPLYRYPPIHSNPYEDHEVRRIVVFWPPKGIATVSRQINCCLDELYLIEAVRVSFGTSW